MKTTKIISVTTIAALIAGVVCTSSPASADHIGSGWGGGGWGYGGHWGGGRGWSGGWRHARWGWDRPHWRYGYAYSWGGPVSYSYYGW